LEKAGFRNPAFFLSKALTQGIDCDNNSYLEGKHINFRELPGFTFLIILKNHIIFPFLLCIDFLYGISLKEAIDNVKKISVFLFLAIFTPLLFLQVSCSTVKEQPAEEAAAETAKAPDAVKDLEVVKAAEPVKTEEAIKTSEAEKTPVAVEGATAALFLADTHKSAGVVCSECHKETPPASEVPTEMCMTCHEDYREVAASAIDPHNAHVEFTRCGDCHHGHRESENQCLSCHSFSLEAP